MKTGILFALAFLSFASFLALMIFGFGLEPKNWLAIVGFYLVQIFAIATHIVITERL